MLRINLTLHENKDYIFYTTKNPADYYTFRAHDDEHPDEEELVELYLLDMERLEADWIHDTMMYNEAYTTDTNYFNLQKMIKHL